ncbi:tetratricopeptide repeat protein (plasmid) [Pseudorhodobacter turbinis]|uniref:Tetratricopeptide repeat protein n=1 Tax=Pseudorhodobacter turbinis TaxID=2500533 RepID=A0A4P8ELV4_9RHOB|nr:tetratricopeptide repeat protein [Pseudorhodobacter turbinis]QCO58098.1 tetratricopeptide repeat protein [Pseudorhodobacter turbinis]
MSIVPGKLRTKMLLPLVLAAFTQTAYAATTDYELLLPQAPKDTAYLLPISQALSDGNLAQAETLVRARVGIAPEDAVAWEVLGVTLALGGDASGADAAYAKAVELEPKRLSAWVKRGDLAEAAGKMPDAMTYWTAAIEIAPAYAAAHQRLGGAYAAAGNLPRAIEHLEAAVAIEKPDVFAVKTELALVYNRAGRPGDTLALLADAATKKDARLMLALGNAHAQLGDAETALSQYQRGIDAAPDDNALLKAKGALQVETGDMTNAVATLSKPAAAMPVDSFSNLQYARALLATGNSTDAIAAAERAASTDKTSDIARQALFVAARAHLLNRDFPKAIETTAQLVALFPDDPASWREHAAISGAIGRYPAAKDIYDEAIARFDNDAELLRGRSIVNLRLGQIDAAAEDAGLAASLAPDWLEPRFLLGEIEQARGQNDKAEAAFRAALAINPAHWPSMVNTAALRLAAGDTAEALQLAQMAVEASGGAQAALDVLGKAKAQ